MEESGPDGWLALPVRRFGSLVGTLVLSGDSAAWPRPELELLSEAFAILAEPLNELDQARQALGKFQELTGTAIESLPDGHTGHVAAVCQLTSELAEYLDLSSQSRRRLWNAALYHDVGKLLLPGRQRLEIERRHAEEGADFLIQSGSLAELAPLVQYHHERYDGGGPTGLKGEELSLEHYVLILAESFEEFLHLNPHLEFQMKVKVFFQEKAGWHHPDAMDALAGLIESGRLDRLR